MPALWNTVNAMQLVLIWWTNIAVIAESTRSCVNETHQIECPPGYVITIEHGSGGFSASSGQCDGRVDCETPFIQGAGESWGSNLEALAIQKCKNKNACSIFVVSWQGALSECGNRNTRMVYLEIEHHCTQQATTATIATTTTATISTITIKTITNTTTTHDEPSTYSPSTQVTAMTNDVTTDQSQQPENPLDSTNNRKTLDWYVYVAAGVGGLCIIIVIILIVVCLKRRRKRKHVKQPQSMGRQGLALYTDGAGSSVMSTPGGTRANNKHKYDPPLQLHPNDASMFRNRDSLKGGQELSSGPAVGNNLSEFGSPYASIGHGSRINAHITKNDRADQITVGAPEKNNTLGHDDQQIDTGNVSSHGGSDVYASVQKKTRKASENTEMFDNQIYDRTSSILTAQTDPEDPPT